MFTDNLQKLMDANSLNRTDVARITGASKSAVSKWFNEPDREPQSAYLRRIANHFNVTVDWLLSGENVAKVRYKGDVIPLHPRSLPVINLLQAASLCDHDLDSIKDKAIGWEGTASNVSDKAFCLIAKGDQMTSQSDKRSIQEGAILIVEPFCDGTDVNGKIVVAKTPDSNEATVKEFVRDGESMFLSPLNNRYPVIKVDNDTKIIGIVVQLIVNLMDR